MIRHNTCTTSAADRLLTCFTPEKDLYVHHIVLNYRLWFVHCRTIEDQIAWPHLIEFKVDRAGVVLVALITASKFETKVFLKVVNGSPNESTTVKEER